jgi:hypothetical protein
LEKRNIYEKPFWKSVFIHKFPITGPEREPNRSSSLKTPVFKDEALFLVPPSVKMAIFKDGDTVFALPSGFLAFFPDGILGRSGKYWCRNPPGVVAGDELVEVLDKKATPIEGWSV